MLYSLQVKNLALIDEAKVEFGSGLNVFSGETGAGKSLIIGALGLALGGRAKTDIVRDPEKGALIEMVFIPESEDEVEKIKEAGVTLEDEDNLIISRRIKNGRSIFQINDETVTVSTVKNLSSLLIDIHGQHEHQSLMYKKNHLKLLDSYIGEEIEKVLDDYRTHYASHRELVEKLEGLDMNPAEREREADLLRYEIREIEEAALKEGEDEDLEESFGRMNSSQKIKEAVSEGVAYLSGSSQSASEQLSRALRSISEVRDLDQGAGEIHSSLLEVEGLLSDVNKDLESYLESLDFSEEEFTAVSERLDLINRLKSKYGNNIGSINDSLEEKKELLGELEDHEGIVAALKEKIDKESEYLAKLAGKLDSIRKKGAGELSEKLKNALIDLNFLNVEFEISVTKDDTCYTINGYNEVQFMISTNPGEALKPINEVASGGEISRIMLAIKTVLADSDSIDTLIFDEIDEGISGRTAQKVSESLVKLSRRHQVICITHLPQIAAMGDHHFLIEKQVENGRTKTSLKELEGEEVVMELSRLLSGAEVTDAVKENAREMKRLAGELKANTQIGGIL
ncbi:MAG: DNA repair protein RecN [Lachnospiraceae bacterium]|nr:DNA repair protein RecN [Lachnospiraceae bacterium]